MVFSSNTYHHIRKALLIVALIYSGFFIPAFAQLNFKGRVVNETDNRPVPYAFVGIKGKKAGSVADSSGKFKLTLPSFVRQNDTIIISSIGFQSVRISLDQAFSLSEFKLQESPRLMSPITVRSFLNEKTIGVNSEGFTFFRCWYDERTGGEIGRMINIPHKEYKLERIRFKADNKCDTCLVRLHIRNIINDFPGEELISENIIVPITRLTINNSPEIDLRPYNIILTDRKIFVGFEVINCKNTTSQFYSLCFVGTEYGDYVYKSFVHSPWETDIVYSLYLKLDIRY